MSSVELSTRSVDYCDFATSSLTNCIVSMFALAREFVIFLSTPILLDFCHENFLAWSFCFFYFFHFCHFFLLIYVDYYKETFDIIGDWHKKLSKTYPQVIFLGTRKTAPIITHHSSACQGLFKIVTKRLHSSVCTAPKHR